MGDAYARCSINFVVPTMPMEGEIINGVQKRVWPSHHESLPRNILLLYKVRNNGLERQEINATIYYIT